MNAEHLISGWFVTSESMLMRKGELRYVWFYHPHFHIYSFIYGTSMHTVWVLHISSFAHCHSHGFVSTPISWSSLILSFRYLFIDYHKHGLHTWCWYVFITAFMVHSVIKGIEIGFQQVCVHSECVCVFWYWLSFLANVFLIALTLRLCPDPLTVYLWRSVITIEFL